jgi:heme biosynthesis-associated TPR repeat protein
MRLAIWFVLLFAVAVVAATTFGTNDGVASFYWSGWRLDLSLNLFLLLFVGACFLAVGVIQGVSSLSTLPQRAREWRTARRDRTGQAALREALAQYFGGRYARAQKAAQRALAIQAETPELAQDNEFTVLGHLLAAGSAHRLQNRAVRDQELARALELSQHSLAARSAGEGARLLAAEWALDDRDPARATELLNELPLGVARRTSALRLRLQAARLGRQPQEALKTARLLVKHQAFSPVAAEGLLRSLAFESLETVHDLDQLRRLWAALEPADRRDPSWPPAPRREPPRSAARRTRDRGCVRSGTASPSSGSRSASASPKRWRRPQRASAPTGCPGSSRPRTRCRAMARSRSPPASPCRARALGQGARASGAGFGRHQPRSGGAPQGLDRAGRTGPPGERSGARGTRLRGRRTPSLNSPLLYFRAQRL